MKLGYQLPEIYKKFLPSDLLSFDPNEKLATCQSCAMAKENGHRGKVFYKPDLKCCTFEPVIPNFMVGAIFEDPQMVAGQEVLREKIKRRDYALPLGMLASVRYQLEFTANKEKIFGQDTNYLCSYYDRDTGLCKIWRQRGVVCTTFHCKSSYGNKGMRFWSQLSDLLSFVEQALMEEALIHLDFSPRQVMELMDYLNRSEGSSQERRSWVLPEKKARALWNGYFDEQEEFFRKTFAIARQMSQKDFFEMIGESGEKVLSDTLKDLQILKSLQGERQ